MYRVDSLFGFAFSFERYWCIHELLMKVLLHLRPTHALNQSCAMSSRSPPQINIENNRQYHVHALCVKLFTAFIPPYLYLSMNNQPPGDTCDPPKRPRSQISVTCALNRLLRMHSDTHQCDWVFRCFQYHLVNTCSWKVRLLKVSHVTISFFVDWKGASYIPHRLLKYIRFKKKKKKCAWF